MNLSNVTVPRAEQKLLAAVLALALLDASGKPGKDGQLIGEAPGAIEFLFGDRSPLAMYLAMLDVDPGRYRQALLERMYADPLTAIGNLTEFQLRAMRWNYERWLALRGQA